MDKKTVYEEVITKLKNNKYIVFLFVLSSILIYLEANISAIKSIFNSFKESEVVKTDTITKIDTLQIVVSPKATSSSNIPKKNKPVNTGPLYAVSVMTKPENFDLYINGKPYGTTSRTISLYEGSYILSLKKGEVEHYKDVLTVPDQKVLAIDFSSNQY